jgi:hypothetical protein
MIDSTITEINPYHVISGKDYTPNFFIDTGNNSIIMFGQTKSGKTTILMNYIIRKAIHEYDNNNIIIFSRTANTDITYRPLFLHLHKNENKINYYETIDINVLKEIIE